MALDQNMENVRSETADLKVKETHPCINHKQMIKINFVKQAIF